MTSNLVWVPVPNGAPWWPGVIIDAHELDPLKYTGVVTYWESTRSKRGRDPQNRDVLVMLYGLRRTSDDEGHSFAVVPKTSLRPFYMYLDSFGEGVISSGKDMGLSTSIEERNLLKIVIGEICAVAKRPASQASQDVAPQVAPTVSNYNTLGKHPRSNRGLVDENKDVQKLKRELQQIRKKMAKVGTRSQGPSPELASRAEVATPVLSVPFPGKIGYGTSSSPLIAQFYPEMSSSILRMWDFCHSFSVELGLAPVQLPGTTFASIASFEACLTEPDSSLFVHVASALVNCISSSQWTEPEERWNFLPVFSARIGGKCTALTWENYYDLLVAKCILKPPNNPQDKKDLMVTLVDACMDSDLIRSVVAQRVRESNLDWASNDGSQLVPPTALHIQLLPSNNFDLARLQLLSEATNATDFYQIEQIVEICRRDHEQVDPESGRVLARSFELNTVMQRQEQLFGRLLTATKRLKLKRAIRSLSFGKDHLGRSLYSFVGDEEEEECRVWAKDDASDRWFLYRGDFEILRLMEIITERNTQGELKAILYSAKRRFRPSSVLNLRNAVNDGWRFTGNELLGRRVIKYSLTHGLLPGIVASFRIARRIIYRVIFSRQIWETGEDITQEELVHLVQCSERLSGDFPLPTGPLVIPPHPLHKPWIPVHPDQTHLALVQGPHKKFIGLGVVIATTPIGPDMECDAVVLQDGGEFVPIYGRNNLHEAVNGAKAFAISTVLLVDNIQTPLYNKVDRYKPLSHHVGPQVGLEGVVKLWGKIVMDNITDLRGPMLEAEQAFVERAPQMWPSREEGDSWRRFVDSATSVKDFALALECLLQFAERIVVEKVYNTPPPQTNAATPQAAIRQLATNPVIANSGNVVSAFPSATATLESVGQASTTTTPQPTALTVEAPIVQAPVIAENQSTKAEPQATTNSLESIEQQVLAMPGKTETDELSKQPVMTENAAASAELVEDAPAMQTSAVQAPKDMALAVQEPVELVNEQHHGEDVHQSPKRMKISPNESPQDEVLVDVGAMMIETEAIEREIAESDQKILDQQTKNLTQPPDSSAQQEIEGKQEPDDNKKDEEIVLVPEIAQGSTEENALVTSIVPEQELLPIIEESVRFQDKEQLGEPSAALPPTKEIPEQTAHDERLDVPSEEAIGLPVVEKGVETQLSPSDSPILDDGHEALSETVDEHNGDVSTVVQADPSEQTVTEQSVGNNELLASSTEQPSSGSHVVE